MSRVVMFVFNDCTTDARVLREAASLVAAGHRVTVMARPRDPLSLQGEREFRDGFEIVRVPSPIAGASSGPGPATRGGCAAGGLGGSTGRRTTCRPEPQSSAGSRWQPP